MNNTRLYILIFNLVFLAFALSSTIFYFFVRYFNQKIATPKIKIFATQFRFFINGDNKNCVYLETALPFFPQQLIDIQTLLNLMNRKDKNKLLKDYQYFVKEKKWKHFSEPTKIVFNLGSRRIQGFLQIQEEQKMRKLIFRDNKMIVGNFTNLQKVPN